MIRTQKEKEEDLRMVCLEFAIKTLESSTNPKSVIKMANEFYNYIKNGNNNEN